MTSPNWCGCSRRRWRKDIEQSLRKHQAGIAAGDPAPAGQEGCRAQAARAAPGRRQSRARTYRPDAGGIRGHLCDQPWGAEALGAGGPQAPWYRARAAQRHRKGSAGGAAGSGEGLSTIPGAPSAGAGGQPDQRTAWAMARCADEQTAPPQIAEHGAMKTSLSSFSDMANIGWFMLLGNT